MIAHSRLDRAITAVGDGHGDAVAQAAGRQALMRAHAHAGAAYRPPVLTRYGDIRAHTLGSTPGTGESGMPTVFDFSLTYGDYDAIP